MKNVLMYIYIYNANYENIKKLGQENLLNIFLLPVYSKAILCSLMLNMYYSPIYFLISSNLLQPWEMQRWEDLL